MMFGLLAQVSAHSLLTGMAINGRRYQAPTFILPLEQCLPQLNLIFGWLVTTVALLLCAITPFATHLPLLPAQAAPQHLLLLPHLLPRQQTRQQRRRHA